MSFILEWLFRKRVVRRDAQPPPATFSSYAKPKDEFKTISALQKMNETLQLLEKRESLFSKKADLETERAKKFIQAKNKRGALQCLRKKMLYEKQIEQLGNYQMRIHDQIIMLEGANATMETVDVLRTSAAVMRRMHDRNDLGDVENVMDEINETMDDIRAIGDLLAPEMDIDEVELMKMLNSLEDDETLEKLPDQLQEELTRPAVLPQPNPAYRGSAAVANNPAGAAAPSVRPADMEEKIQIDELVEEMA